MGSLHHAHSVLMSGQPSPPPRLTATVTATAATNGRQQQPATADNAHKIRANLEYVRPEKRKVRSSRTSRPGPRPLGAAGSHRGERPIGIPDGHEQRPGTRPRSRTDLNGSGCPHRNLRIRRSSLRPEGARVVAWLRSGDGPLSVRARPSSIRRDCDRRATSPARLSKGRFITRH